MTENCQTQDAARSRIILFTSRLILRFATDDDIPVMYERVFGDADVMRHVFLGAPMSKERAEGFMREHFTFGGTPTGIAVLEEKSPQEKRLGEKSSRGIIGFAGLFPCDALGSHDLEIGFVMARMAWGNGYATEIGEAQLVFGFEQLGRERLLGLVHPQNQASIHALTKLGMRYLKDVAGPKRPPRSIYVMNAAEWRARPAAKQRA
jgi:RimJ/RimL family protein N-acetyltransferase